MEKNKDLLNIDTSKKWRKGNCEYENILLPWEPFFYTCIIFFINIVYFFVLN